MSNLHETWWKWLSHEAIIFTKFHKDWTKIVEFLSTANFWKCAIFLTQTLFALFWIFFYKIDYSEVWTKPKNATHSAIAKFLPDNQFSFRVERRLPWLSWPDKQESTLLLLMFLIDFMQLWISPCCVVNNLGLENITKIILCV